MILIWISHGHRRWGMISNGTDHRVTEWFNVRLHDNGRRCLHRLTTVVVLYVHHTPCLAAVGVSSEALHALSRISTMSANSTSVYQRDAEHLTDYAPGRATRQHLLLWKCLVLRIILVASLPSCLVCLPLEGLPVSLSCSRSPVRLLIETHISQSQRNVCTSSIQGASDRIVPCTCAREAWKCLLVLPEP